MSMLYRLTETLRRCRMRGGMDDEAIVAELLAEMRVPTQDMIVAAFDAISEPLHPDTWTAAIDAILAHSEPAHTSSELGHG